MMSRLRVQVGFMCLMMALSADLFAYLDPSTGSMIISAIVGIIASVALAVKTYWYKLKGLFRGSDKVRDDTTQDEQGND